MRSIYHDIRESLWRDFKDRIEEAGIEDEFILNESTMSATHIPTGNVLLSKGFKKSSGKQTAKLKSIAGATHVAIEEAEEIEEDEFRQLDDSLRTVKGQIQIIQIFNPPHKRHWIWKRWYNLIDTPETDEEGSKYYRAVPKAGVNLLSIFSTYLDNYENLNESFISNLLSYTGEYLMTVVKGFISEGVRGRIYTGWLPVKAMPGLYNKFYGLDFGYNDPMALVELERHNMNLWAKQMVYESRLTIPMLDARMKALGIPKSAKIYADSAEPGDIAELQKLGWNVIPVKKYPGSVLAGVRFVKKYTVHYTEDSPDLIRENQEYKWELDRDKMPTDQPEDKNNHLMDAIRYSMDDVKVGATSSGSW
jgi:phage terminase large subunit